MEPVSVAINSLPSNDPFHMQATKASSILNLPTNKVYLIPRDEDEDLARIYSRIEEEFLPSAKTVLRWSDPYDEYEYMVLETPYGHRILLSWSSDEGGAEVMWVGSGILREVAR